MNKEQDGPKTPRAIDLKAFDPHYVMPETIKGDLDNLFEAFGVVGLLAESSGRECGPTVAANDMAPLHRSLATLGKRLMADMPPSFPTLRGAPAQ
jgi:hypothetical protein